MDRELVVWRQVRTDQSWIGHTSALILVVFQITIMLLFLFLPSCWALFYWQRLLLSSIFVNKTVEFCWQKCFWLSLIAFLVMVGKRQIASRLPMGHHWRLHSEEPVKYAGPHFNINMSSQYRKSHCGTMGFPILEIHLGTETGSFRLLTFVICDKQTVLVWFRCLCRRVHNCYIIGTGAIPLLLLHVSVKHPWMHPHRMVPNHPETQRCAWFSGHTASLATQILFQLPFESSFCTVYQSDNLNLCS